MSSKVASNNLPLTISFVVRGDEVLLGFKKKGFGAGNWNGFGGKLEPGETVAAAAVRELEEESGIRATQLTQRGELDLFYDQTADMSGLGLKLEDERKVITLHIFVTSRFLGEPQETEEMRPQWFQQKSLPFDQMWADDRHWLPQVLQGHFVTGSFWFRGTEELVDYTLHSKALAP